MNYYIRVHLCEFVLISHRVIWHVSIHKFVSHNVNGNMSFHIHKNSHHMSCHMSIHLFVSHYVSWHMSFHISICFIQNGMNCFVCSFVTYTNPLPFCSVLTVLTTMPKKKTKTKKKRIRFTKERPNPMMGNPLGLLFVRVQKLLIMCMVYITYT